LQLLIRKENAKNAETDVILLTFVIFVESYLLHKHKRNFAKFLNKYTDLEKTQPLC
jgi:hypothetical protein